MAALLLTKYLCIYAEATEEVVFLLLFSLLTMHESLGSGQCGFFGRQQEACLAQHRIGRETAYIRQWNIRFAIMMRAFSCTSLHTRRGKG